MKRPVLAMVCAMALTSSAVAATLPPPDQAARILLQRLAGPVVRPVPAGRTANVLWTFNGDDNAVCVR
ncbi:hypothetical protein JW905_13630, partial [bacterium]|nr:hypothetical protein [candidate division CSSED10-310 bacterium]